jgi:hypothetical protein
MTQDEIIEMAQECNLIGMRPHLDGIYTEALETFAQLVAAKAIEQRTWVGLTDESRKQLINKCWNEYIAGKEDASSFSEWISVAIEAELKEKNGYAEEENT